MHHLCNQHQAEGAHNMPDFGAPVAGKGIDASQGFNTLNSIMNFQQNQQALQMNALKIQEQQSATQQAQQQMNERQLLQSAMQSGVDPDGNSLKDANGEINPTAMGAFAAKYLPLTGQTVNQSIISTLDNKNKLNESTRQLGQNYKNDLGGIIRSYIGTNATPQDINSALNQYADQNPQAAQAIQYSQSLVNHLNPNMPQGQRDNMLLHLSQAFQPAATTEKEQAPQIGTVTGPSGGLQPYNANPYAPGGIGPQGMPIGQGVAPGISFITDSRTGNVYAINQQQPGTAILAGHGGTLPLGAGTSGYGGNQTAPMTPQNAPQGQPQAPMQPQAPNMPPVVNATPNRGGEAPPSLGLGEGDIVKINSAQVANNRKIAQDNLTNYDVLQKVKNLASTPGIYLGPGSDYVGQLATAVGGLTGFEGAKDYANNYNGLVKYMAQNAARMSNQMGLSGSDSRLDLALHSQPNQQMDPRTVQDVAQYLSGLVRMNAAKANAMDNWLQQPGNSIQNENQFESLWRNNADPRLFQLNEMTDQGAAANYSKLHIKKSELPALQQKHDILERLGAFGPLQPNQGAQ